MPEQAKKGEVEEKRLSLATNHHLGDVSVKHPAGTRSAYREMVAISPAGPEAKVGPAKLYV